MNAVPGFSHLYRRGAVYWFRRRVPMAVAAAFDFKEWKETLGTKDLAQAKRLVRVRGVETDGEIRAAEAKLALHSSPPLTSAEAKAWAAWALAGWLEDDESHRICCGDRGWRSAAAMLEERGLEVRQALATGDWDSLPRARGIVLQHYGRWYPHGDASDRLLGWELLKAEQRFLELVERRQTGEIVEVPEARRDLPGLVGPRTVGQLVDAYRANRETEFGPESTARKYAHIFRAVEEALGRERALGSLTRADVRGVRDLLARVPSNAGKKYPGLTLRQAVEKADADDAPRLSPGTLASYMQSLNAVLNWAVAEEWMDRNPASGLVGKAEASVRRRGFTPEELQTLFEALQGERQETPWRFWVPALALYSGARAGELAQLRRSDVVARDDLLCVTLSEFDPKTGLRVQGKRLKTAASERTFPLHPELLAAGFSDLLDGQADGQLFPGLKEGPNGGYSHELSKWFGRFLDKLKLTDRALVFHSFRHGFRDACRRAHIQRETIDALGGWATPGVGAKYGDRDAIPLLWEAIQRVEFGAFRLPEIGRQALAGN